MVPSGEYVLPNFRYLAVYNELVARISQGQQSLALFVAHLRMRSIYYRPQP